MLSRKLILVTLLAAIATAMQSQTLDVQALAKYSPTTAREVYEVAKYVKLSSTQQQELAKAIDAEAKQFLKAVESGNGILGVNDTRALAKQRDKALSRILNSEQLRQYWRGVYDKEAAAEGNAVANRYRKEYGITDQNWKFIRIAFYKIGLDSRVNDKLLPAAEAKKANAALRREMLKSIEDKGGIRINDDMTLTVLREFDPNKLHKE